MGFRRQDRDRRREMRQARRLSYVLVVVFAKCCVCLAVALVLSLAVGHAQDVKEKAPVKDLMLGDFECLENRCSVTGAQALLLAAV